VIYHNLDVAKYLPKNAAKMENCPNLPTQVFNSTSAARNFKTCLELEQKGVHPSALAK
jgi:hypothetical protein